MLRLVLFAVYLGLLWRKKLFTENDITTGLAPAAIYSRCSKPGHVAIVYKCIHEYTLANISYLLNFLMQSIYNVFSRSMNYLKANYPRSLPIAFFITPDHLWSTKHTNRMKRLAKLSPKYSFGLRIHKLEELYEEEIFSQYYSVFSQPLEYVYMTNTADIEDFSVFKEVEQELAIKFVWASIDFADVGLGAVEMAKGIVAKKSPLQHSFVIVPDAHRPKGHSLAPDIAREFAAKGYRIVNLRECLSGRP